MPVVQCSGPSRWSIEVLLGQSSSKSRHNFESWRKLLAHGFVSAEKRCRDDGLVVPASLVTFLLNLDQVMSRVSVQTPHTGRI